MWELNPAKENLRVGAIAMKRKATYQELAAIAHQHGFKPLPPDHPIFSEGPSITFSSRVPKQWAAKDTPSQPTDSPTGSDATNSSEPA
jgi:hypothetical protein